MAALATEPFTFRRTAMVMSFAFGISFSNLSYVGLSNMTKLASFSLTLPLLHFFFLDLPPAMAAFIFASLDFCTTLLAPMAARCLGHPGDWERAARPLSP